MGKIDLRQMAVRVQIMRDVFTTLAIVAAGFAWIFDNFIKDML